MTKTTKKWNGDISWTMTSRGHFFSKQATSLGHSQRMTFCGHFWLSKHCSGQVKLGQIQVILGQVNLGQVKVRLGQVRLGVRLGQVRGQIRLGWVGFGLGLGQVRFGSVIKFTQNLHENSPKNMSTKSHPKNVHEQSPKKRTSRGQKCVNEISSKVSMRSHPF